MSFDLGIFSAVEPLDADRAADVYGRLCQLEDWQQLLRPDPRIDEFVAAITERWPQIDDVPEDEIDESPWSVEFDQSPAHVILSMVWSRVDDVANACLEAALEVGLYVFDPQEGVLYAAGAEPQRATPPAEAITCITCGQPIDPSAGPYVESPGPQHFVCAFPTPEAG